MGCVNFLCGTNILFIGALGGLLPFLILFLLAKDDEERKALTFAILFMGMFIGLFALAGSG